MNTDYQLIMHTPAAVIGVACDEAFVLSVNYLSARRRLLPPRNMLAAECQRQIAAYIKQPRAHRFDLPLLQAKTAYQQRVRRVVQAIAGGSVMTYGEVAKRLGNSSARAVGGACRANAIPLIVPCHRVVAANGLGGFMGSGGRHCLEVKKKLLHREGIAC